MVSRVRLSRIFSQPSRSLIHNLTTGSSQSKSQFTSSTSSASSGSGQKRDYLPLGYFIIKSQSLQLYRQYLKFIQKEVEDPATRKDLHAQIRYEFQCNRGNIDEAVGKLNLRRGKERFDHLRDMILMSKATIMKRFLNLPQLVMQYQKGRPLMALDVGSKFVGIAISDPTNKIAIPLTVLHREQKEYIRFSIQLDRLIKEKRVQALFVGQPLAFPESCKKIRHFIEQMWQVGRLETPAVLVDETDTTTEVVCGMLEEDIKVTRKMRTHDKEFVDKMAAAHILQRGLDSLNDVLEQIEHRKRQILLEQQQQQQQKQQQKKPSSLSASPKGSKLKK